MTVNLVNTFNISDNVTLELMGARAVTTAVVGGTTYLFVAAYTDSGVSVYSVSASGTLTNTNNVTDGGALNLVGAGAVATVQLGGTTYLYVAGAVDNGISVFTVSNSGALTGIQNVADSMSLLLGGVDGLAIVTIGGATYLYAAGGTEKGVQGFSINSGTGFLTPTQGISDFGTLQYDGVRSVHTANVGGSTYLFTAAETDSGVSVMKINPGNGFFSANVDNVVDGGPRYLGGGYSVVTAVVGDKTYLFASGATDNGVSVFSVDATGALTNVFNLGDNATLHLAAVISITTAVISGTAYLFAAALGDNGVSAFAVAADGSLISVADVSDGGALNLGGASAVTTAVVGGNTFLMVSSQSDNGVSVFRVDVTGWTITGTAAADTIDATHSIAGQVLPSDLGDILSGLGGNDVIGGLGGNDTIIGGAGRDTMTGGAGADVFQFNAKGETVKGAGRDVITDFSGHEGELDKIDLSAIDAKRGGTANDTFKFIGTKGFHHKKGELHFKLDVTHNLTLIEGDIDGNGKADFQIELTGLHPLLGVDFNL